MKYANMHLHSVFSDGIFKPLELCEMVKQMGYAAVVLTDHDCAAGFASMKKAAEMTGLETMVGAEFYGKFEDTRTLHILGYDFDPYEPGMAEHLKNSRECMTFLTKARFDVCMTEGVLPKLSWDEVMSSVENDAWVCNEQIFAAYLKKGVFTQKDYWDFIKSFRTPKVDVTRPYAVQDAETVIRLIRNAGGVAVLAHPYRITQLLPTLYGMGIRGVECDHPEIEAEDAVLARRFAASHNMYVTGGTDHTGQPGNNMERGDDPGHKEGKWDMAPTPYTADVYCGATKEEFKALKQRIYG